jgi:tetratricopeptide (TPR) repeat protein
MSRIGLIVLLAVVAGGCAQQRPITAIRESGDREMMLGNYAKAAAEYNEIVDRYGGDWEAQYKLGLCALELDDVDTARQALEIAHTRRPDNEEIVDALAETMYREKDFNRLHSFLRQRAETVGTPESYLRLAQYAIAMEDADSATAAYEMAIVLDGGRAVEPYLAAASFAEQIGDLELAVRRLRQAYGIDPYHETVKSRLVAMGEIPGPTLALPPGR